MHPKKISKVTDGSSNQKRAYKTDGIIFSKCISSLVFQGTYSKLIWMCSWIVRVDQYWEFCPNFFLSFLLILFLFLKNGGCHFCSHIWVAGCDSKFIFLRDHQFWWRCGAIVINIFYLDVLIFSDLFPWVNELSCREYRVQNNNNSW